MTQARPVRLFLDTNVLISAAWKDGSKVIQLWELANVQLLTSPYVLIECRRNLPGRDQQLRLERLLEKIEIFHAHQGIVLPENTLLPDKDLPVLAAAVFARADFLVTGDKRHFGQWYGAAFLGVRIDPPGTVLELLQDENQHQSH
ncbi:MAG TPA: PIN domain-containing protein [Acidobacteriaceae bacterium]|nr:PIN domain-containing protein [Acidobacteriaceae bacterium]